MVTVAEVLFRQHGMAIVPRPMHYGRKQRQEDDSEHGKGHRWFVSKLYVVQLLIVLIRMHCTQ